MQPAGGPPGAAAWRRFLERLCTYAGAVACAAAVVFLVAFNWQGWPPVVKSGALQAVLIAAAMLACYFGTSRLPGKAALLFAMLACGALLAYLGQRYQSGADSYELFLTWAVLILPWVFAARSGVAWALLLVLANLAVHLYTGRFSPLLLDAIVGSGIMQPPLFWLDLAAVALAEWRAGTAGPGLAARFLPRLAGTLLLAVATLGLVQGVVDGRAADAWLWATRGAMVVALGGGFLLYRWRRDLLMLTLCWAAAIAVATVLLVRLLADSAGGKASLVIAGGFLLAASAAAAMWLRQVQRQWVKATEPPAAWHIRALLAVCGWAGGLMLLVFVGLVLPDPFGAYTLAAAGALSLVAAWALFRGTPSELRAQFALSLCVAGMGALAVAFTDWLPMAGALLTTSLLGAAVAIAMPQGLARGFGVVCALLALEGAVRVGGWPSPVGAVAAWICAACWLLRTRSAYWLADRHAPLAWGATLALWMLGVGQYLWEGAGETSSAAWQWGAAGWAWLAAAPLVWAAWRLSSRTPATLRKATVGLALGVSLAGIWMPAVAGGLLTVVLGFARCHGALWKGGLLVALYGVAGFYYQLAWSLPVKAATLLALGLVLLLAAYLLNKAGKEAGHG
ncbi:MAG: DUF4401 domain-containing protein [Pigmentiphaga sp.]|nr:DUF4401 domain-containing protein [Pigmentiphaga sp.]MDX3907929.1 DUF4401 domain-containing protein [Pigmentiphaga sp.]